MPQVQVSKKSCDTVQQTGAGGLRPKFIISVSKLNLWSLRYTHFPIHCILLRSPPNKL